MRAEGAAGACVQVRLQAQDLHPRRGHLVGRRHVQPLIYLLAADEVIVGNIPVADEDLATRLVAQSLAIDMADEFTRPWAALHPAPATL